MNNFRESKKKNVDIKIQKLMSDILDINDETSEEQELSKSSVEFLSQQLSNSMMKHVEKVLQSNSIIL